jgi:hypothetical protein
MDIVAKPGYYGLEENLTLDWNLKEFTAKDLTI